MGKRVLKSSLIEDENVVAFFTTRDLALKAGEREDMIEEVQNNKKLVCEGLNIPLENLVIPVQTHSDNVELVKKCEPFSSFDNTDALVTKESKIALGLNFADCVPLIFYDPVVKVIASAHAGWRGTVAQIGVKTVEKMIDEFGCEAKNVIALIGPAIGKCCFEVGEEVKQKILKSLDVVGLANPTYALIPSHMRQWDYQELANNAFSDNHADLKLINKLQLLAIGVEKIDVCEYCTFCQSALFYSYRKENGHTARHSAVVALLS